MPYHGPEGHVPLTHKEQPLAFLLLHLTPPPTAVGRTAEQGPKSAEWALLARQVKREAVTSSEFWKLWEILHILSKYIGVHWRAVHCERSQGCLEVE